MRMLFKQRSVRSHNKYDIYGEDGQVLYLVKRGFSWGCCLKVYDTSGQEVGMVRDNPLASFPKFEMYIQGNRVGYIRKKEIFSKIEYQIKVNDWVVKGRCFDWNEDYTILSRSRYVVANISFDWMYETDVYVLDITKPADAFGVLMLVLAVEMLKWSGK